MNRRQKAVSLAKKLLKIVLDENEHVVPERVEALLVVLKEKKIRDLKAVLEIFYLKLNAQLKKESIHVFYSGELDQKQVFDRLRKKFEHYYKRILNLYAQENGALIAGLQICIADDIWEMSVKSRLSALRKPFALIKS